MPTSGGSGFSSLPPDQPPPLIPQAALRTNAHETLSTQPHSQSGSRQRHQKHQSTNITKHHHNNPDRGPPPLQSIAAYRPDVYDKTNDPNYVGHREHKVHKAQRDGQRAPQSPPPESGTTVALIRAQYAASEALNNPTPNEPDLKQQQQRNRPPPGDGRGGGDPPADHTISWMGLGQWLAARTAVIACGVLAAVSAGLQYWYNNGWYYDPIHNIYYFASFLRLAEIYVSNANHVNNKSYDYDDGYYKQSKVRHLYYYFYNADDERYESFSHDSKFYYYYDPIAQLHYAKEAYGKKYILDLELGHYHTKDHSKIHIPSRGPRRSKSALQVPYYGLDDDDEEKDHQLTTHQNDNTSHSTKSSIGTPVWSRFSKFSQSTALPPYLSAEWSDHYDFQIENEKDLLDAEAQRHMEHKLAQYASEGGGQDENLLQPLSGVGIVPPTPQNPYGESYEGDYHEYNGDDAAKKRGRASAKTGGGAAAASAEGGNDYDEDDEYEDEDWDEDDDYGDDDYDENDQPSNTTVSHSAAESDHNNAFGKGSDDDDDDDIGGDYDYDYDDNNDYEGDDDDYNYNYTSDEGDIPEGYHRGGHDDVQYEFDFYLEDDEDADDQYYNYLAYLHRQGHSIPDDELEPHAEFGYIPYDLEDGDAAGGSWGDHMDEELSWESFRRFYTPPDPTPLYVEDPNVLLGDVIPEYWAGLGGFDDEAWYAEDEAERRHELSRFKRRLRSSIYNAVLEKRRENAQLWRDYDAMQTKRRMWVQGRYVAVYGRQEDDLPSRPEKNYRTAPARPDRARWWEPPPPPEKPEVPLDPKYQGPPPVEDVEGIDPDDDWWGDGPDIRPRQLALYAPPPPRWG